jgi:hypothetical protein
MKKALIFACVLCVAPLAMAEVLYTPQDPANFDFGVGVYNPNDPGSLNTVYVTSGSGLRPSDTFQVTMALQMNAIFYNTEALHFSFIYDNSAIEVLHANPVGGWLNNNYNSLSWPNPSSGITGYVSLAQSMGTGTSFISMPTGAVVPFFHATLHIKPGAQLSQVAQFGITIPPYTPGAGFSVGMTLVSHTFALTLPPTAFNYFGGAIHTIPEPTSMSLLGAGVAVLGGGLLRHRRRRAA